MVSFALSVANVNAAAGYYGIEPNDVQYSLIVLYGAMAAFFALEGRFSKNEPTGCRCLLIKIDAVIQQTPDADYYIFATIKELNGHDGRDKTGRNYY